MYQRQKRHGFSADGKAAANSVSPRVLAPQFNTSCATTAPTVPVRTLASLPQSKPALSAATPKLTGAERLLAIWLIGMTFVLSRMILGLLGAVRLVRRSVAVASGPLAEAAEEARRKLGLRTRPSLRDGSLVAVPMTFGILRPIVLVPEGAQGWPAERLQAVMLHEIGHIKRRDWVTAMLAEVTCALYWFHPLVWLAARQLRAESEQACDDLVLTSGIPPAEYADHLLEVVRGLTTRRGAGPAVVTMACKQDIAARIKTILATSKNRSAATGRGLAVAMFAALVVVLPLAMVRPMAAAGAADKAETKTAQPQTDAIPSPQVITVPGDTRSPKQISDWQRINQWRRTLLASHTSPWKATLANGTCVYLTSLWALNGANAEKTWTPDGTLLSDGGGGSLPFYKHFHSTFCNVDVVLVFPSDAVRRQTRVAFGSTETGPSYGTDLAAFERNGGYIGSRRFINFGFQCVFPPAQQKTSLVASLAMGSETVLVSGSPLLGGTRRLATGEMIDLTKAKLVSNSSLAQVQFSLPSRFVRNESEYKIAAIDKEGLPLPIPGVSQSYTVFQGKSAIVRYAFQASKLPLDRIKEFRLTYRSSQPVVFRNVALQPITSAASTNPLAPTQKDKSDRKASLSNLRLIGLALVKYVADHHERFPDAAHWMDQIIPYLVPAQIKGMERQQRITAIFHDPASPPSQLWSYSFNHALSSLSLYQLDSPAQIVAVFESSGGVRNASDGGQSVPHPGRHSGGSDFLFADGHTKFLRAEDTPLLFAKLNPPVVDSSGNLTYLTQPQDTTGWFAPVNPDSRQKIPIQGQAYDRRTMKPLRGTFVIFSQSPKKITVGSVWPSSFTDKAGRFQSVLYPGKNYLMVLENNRFRFAGKTLNYEANGNKGSIFTQATKEGTLRSARSDYMVRWTLPQGYSLRANSPVRTEGADITAFMPIAHSAPR